MSTQIRQSDQIVQTPSPPMALVCEVSDEVGEPKARQATADQESAHPAEGVIEEQQRAGASNATQRRARRLLRTGSRCTRR